MHPLQEPVSLRQSKPDSSISMSQKMVLSMSKESSGEYLCRDTACLRDWSSWVLLGYLRSYLIGRIFSFFSDSNPELALALFGRNVLLNYKLLSSVKGFGPAYLRVIAIKAGKSLFSSFAALTALDIHMSKYMHAYGFQIAVERSRLRILRGERPVHEIPLNGVLPACWTFCRHIHLVDFVGVFYELDFDALRLVRCWQTDYALFSTNFLIVGNSTYVYSERYRGVVCWRPSGQQFAFAPSLSAFAVPQYQTMYFKYRRVSPANPMIGSFQAYLAAVYADLAPFAVKPGIGSCLRYLRDILRFLEELEDRGFEDTLTPLFEAAYEV